MQHRSYLIPLLCTLSGLSLLQKIEGDHQRKKCEIAVLPFDAFSGLYGPSSTFCVIHRLNLSMQMTNRYRDSGFPCLIPLDGLIALVTSPFERRRRELQLFVFMMPFTRELGNLASVSYSSMNFHSACRKLSPCPASVPSHL